MRGVLKVMEGDRKRFAALEKKYKMLQSEHNVLKKTYLELLNGHLDIVDGKNKTIKRLRESKKAMKGQFIKDLDKLYESEYFDQVENPARFFEIYKEIKKKWEN